jgi:hypothetical protein
MVDVSSSAGHPSVVDEHAAVADFSKKMGCEPAFAL